MQTQMPREQPNDELIMRRIGTLETIELNRPHVLNALSFEQIQTLHGFFERARQGDIAAIWLCGAGERAFCAGGDVRRIVQLLNENSLDKVHAFFAAEYRLIHRIHHAQISVLSILDGLVMGGGAGISINGTFRIATEATSFAMPELPIGLFPDVGASFFLNRCPGKIGMWLALTGTRLGAADCLAAGLATHYIPRARLASLRDALAQLPGDCHSSMVANILAQFHEAPGPTDWLNKCDMEVIDDCFSAEQPEEIMRSLQLDPERRVAKTSLAALANGAPSSFAVTVEMMRRARGLSLPACLTMDFRLVLHAVAWPDFREGVRARLVDKDGKPNWTPATLSELDRNEILGRFDKMPDRSDLTFP